MIIFNMQIANKAVLRRAGIAFSKKKEKKINSNSIAISGVSGSSRCITTSITNNNSTYNQKLHVIETHPQLQQQTIPRSNNSNIKMAISKFSTQSTTISDMIVSKTENNKVVIFSKSRCPFCQMTKNLFDSMEGIEAEILELDQVPDGPAIQRELLSLTGQRTVPNIFVRGIHVGGNDDVQAAARTGELQQMLN